jgi:two-component system catabolic regulation response regulator CreB
MKPTHRVYVVDDEPLIASTLAAILSDSGYEAEFFTNPLEALAAVAPGSPTILVSDVTMPDLTGVELAMRVLDICPHCKVFLMSALDSIDELLEAAGALEAEFPFMRKPFHPAVLLDVMQNSLHDQLHAAHQCGGHPSLRRGEGFVPARRGTGVDAFGDPQLVRPEFLDRDRSYRGKGVVTAGTNKRVSAPAPRRQTL